MFPVTPVACGYLFEEFWEIFLKEYLYIMHVDTIVLPVKITLEVNMIVYFLKINQSLLNISRV